LAEEKIMRLIAAAIDDGNVDEDEQREIEQAELQVKHGSQRGDVLDSFMSQKNRNSFMSQKNRNQNFDL